IYVNAGARVNLGYSAEELMKMKAYDIKPEFTEAKLREVLKPLANGEREKIMLQTAHQRNDGSVYQAEVNMQLIEQEQERVFIAIARDITDRLEAEEQIKKTLHEKEILLGEIHHRVKNNLSVISSLLSMQASYVEDKNVHDLFKECETRIKSMGLIHEMLYQQENFSHINFDPYIKSLVEHIASNFKSEEVLVQTRVEVDDLSLDINTAIPCALVINELLTNAFKHAFKNREKGTITVSLNADDDHHVRLVVKDDGVGLPEDIEGNRLYETLGMSLVSGLTAQLKGQLSIKRTGGTAFIVVFPYQAET
ncbi:MAG: histidine kinase dimerization/phosphoacceptor domain -containing protein, partial [Balneolales bacterium]